MYSASAALDRPLARRQHRLDDVRLLHPQQHRHRVPVLRRPGCSSASGSIFFLAFNGAFGGALAGYLTERGLSGTFCPFVATHSAFELTAIVLSGAAGLQDRSRAAGARAADAPAGARPRDARVGRPSSTASPRCWWWPPPSRRSGRRRTWLPPPVKYASRPSCWTAVHRAILRDAARADVQIDALAVRLRPRTPPEAGGSRRAPLPGAPARSVYRCYGVVALPLFVLAFASIEIAQWLPTLVVWWLKPWLDRTILFVLSRAAFGQPTDVAQLWQAQRQVWWRQSWFSLTFRRLSPWRSLTEAGLPARRVVARPAPAPASVRSGTATSGRHC